MRKTLKDDGSMWVVLGDDPRNSMMGLPMQFAKAMTSVGWNLHRIWFWDKANCCIRSEFKSNMDDCIFQFVKHDQTPYYNKDIQLDVVDFEVPKAVRWEGSYTVAFPMEMLIRMIAGSSPVDGIVLDPFVGTGTTALAAASLGRHSIGIDMNPNELDIANRRMLSFEKNGYIEKGWLHQPGGYRPEEAGPRITLGGPPDGKMYQRKILGVLGELVNRKKVTVRKGIQKGMDFTPLWLSKNCCDDECGCVKNTGCPCEHDCHCPDASLPHTSMSMSSDSLAMELQFSTRSSNSNHMIERRNVNLDGGTWQEPVQVGFFESDEPGIEEPEDAVDAKFVRSKKHWCSGCDNTGIKRYDPSDGDLVKRVCIHFGCTANKVKSVAYGPDNPYCVHANNFCSLCVGSMEKGGGAAWARAEGKEPDWKAGGNWKNPVHWRNAEDNETEHRGAKIPHASLTDIELNTNPEHKQILRGRNKNGKLVYMYKAAAVDKGQQEMFERVKEFNKQYTRFTSKLKANLGTGNDENDVLYLIAKTGFRIGSDVDTKARVDAYGASTLRATHISVHGDTSTINFIGKAGVIIQKEVTDRLLARMLRGRLTNKRDMEKVFNTHPRKVLKQLRTYTGRPFQVKDIRDVIAQAMARETIGKTPKPVSMATFTIAKKIVAEEVAKVLGNTPEIAQRNYIPQEMYAEWESNIENFVSKAIPDMSFDFLTDVVYDRTVKWTEKNSWRGEDE